MPDFVIFDLETELITSIGCCEKHAFVLLVVAAAELDIGNDESDKLLSCCYIEPVNWLLDVKEYIENPYYKNLQIPMVERGQWRCRKERYKLYEAFDYAANQMLRYPYNVVFTDLCHDVSDDLLLYKRMKLYKKMHRKPIFLLDRKIDVCYL